jgi:hypothetical protein
MLCGVFLYNNIWLIPHREAKKKVETRNKTLKKKVKALKEDLAFYLMEFSCLLNWDFKKSENFQWVNDMNLGMPISLEIGAEILERIEAQDEVQDSA